MVHETIQTVATASDEEKIAALKKGLGYAFLSDDTFERKQLFLQALRGCTSIELLILPVLNDSNDPYVVREGYETASPSAGWVNPGILTSTDSKNFVTKGDWKRIANREECGNEPLLTFLSSKIRVDEGATEGAVRLLDGKGLAKAEPNLQRSDCKGASMARIIPHLSVHGVNNRDSPCLQCKATPLESSRTEFGRDFLRFCLT